MEQKEGNSKNKQIKLDEIKIGVCLYCYKKCDKYNYYHIECLEREWNKLRKYMNFPKKNKQELRQVKSYIQGVKKGFKAKP